MNSKYVGFQLLMLFVIAAMLAINVGMAIAFGNPVNWAAAVFITPLVIIQMVFVIRAVQR